MSTFMRSRKRQVISAIGLTVVAGFALSGCSSTPIGGDGGETGDAIGVSGMFLTDPFQVVMMDSIAEAGAAAGANMLPATNADGDTAKQISDIQSLISQDIGGLIAVPIDADAIVPAIEQANEASIPVVTVDMGANGGEIYMTIRADNYAMGENACGVIGDELGGTGTVLNLQGALSSANGLDRSNGFIDCMEANFPDIEVISRPTDWQAEKAVSEAQTVVTTNDIDGIFMASDSVMADGIRNLLEDLDMWKPAGEDGHIVLGSVDGTPLSLELVREGYIDVVAAQPVDMYSELAVKYVVDAMDGVVYEAGPTEHGSEIVEENGSFADMLPSPTVTKANVDDESLWGNKAE